MSETSVTVVGPGAIGAALAGGVVEAGGSPTLVVRTAFERLQVEWPSGSCDVAARCVTNAAELAPADVVIVATKATQNSDVADHVRAAVGPGSVVLIAQNGVDQADRFDGLGPDVEVVPAIVMMPSDRHEPGRVTVGTPSKLIIPAGRGADLVSSVFVDSFIEIDASDDWTSAAWLKLMLNASVGGIGVLTRQGPDVFADAEAQQMVLDMMIEVAAVGRAVGADLGVELPEQLQRHVITQVGGHTTSIVHDRLAGRPTEWRERNQIVVDIADRLGIDVPVNRTVATLMRLGEPTD